MRTNHWYFITALIIIFTGCKPSNSPSEVNSITEVNPHVFAYTSGVISKADAITIEFTDNIAEEEAIGRIVTDKVLTFSPSIAGELTWKNARTLKFTPDEMLNSGTTYQCKVAVSKLLKKAKGNAAQFDFEFRTKDQNLAVQVDNLRAANNDDLSQQVLLGQVFTTDIAEPALLEEILSAKQGGKNLEIEWTHDSELAHQFIIKGIDRGSNASEVALDWSGKPLNIEDKGSEKVEVPSLSDFKVRDAQVVHTPDQYVLLQFSDPLLKRQNLEGLIQIENYQGTLRYTINGNEVRVYPSTRLSGESDVKVNAGIRNLSNARMKNPSEWSMVFEDIKPKVKLVGSGVIMPSTDGLIFPFEAIGLNAIELEVFKIYNNNILQFLQSNQLSGGSYQMNAVGNIILQKKIDLQALNPNSSTQRWMRYALDLDQLFEQDPQAIYQIRIGFRPGYSALSCSGDNQLAAAPEQAYDPENIRSIMDSWYGINGYYDGYDWDNRDNPCYPEYYNSDLFVQRNILASNLGIISKAGPGNEMTAIVTDLRDAGAVTGATVEVYDYQQQLIGQGQTDGQGLAQIQLDDKPFVVVAKQGQEIGYLRVMEGDALSLSRFDVAGSSIQKGLKGYTYGERGVWRPGDSVYLNFVLDDKANELPENYPIQFEVFDARGQSYLKRTSANNVDQVYPIHFATDPESPTGNWSAVIKVGGATFRKSLKIETVKPNRIEIDLDFGQEEITGRSNVQAQINGKWLHGAPASDLRAVVEAQLQPVTTGFAKYPSFQFDDPARRYYSSSKVIFDDQLDGNGNASFSQQLLGNQSVPGKMSASFRSRVFEKGGEFSTDAFSLPYSPYEAYAGVEVPKNDYGESRIEVGKNGRVRFVMVDAKGKPLANRNLSVGFYRVSWRWWWDRNRDNVTEYNSTTHNNAIANTEITTNASGEASWSIQPERWGRYLVRVCDLDGGHCSGSYFYSGYPWYDNSDGGREVASMLNFKSDKSSYQVGEQVQLTIPGGKAGRALVTLESGSQVVDQFWTNTDEGENTINFKATAAMAPTIYANVSLIQAHGQTENDLPIRLYGIIPIEVKDPSTILTPTIAMPDELKPEKEFTVEIGEQNGKDMTYTLAIVDEGLLGLTRFKTPNPHQSFYAREALGIKTWDVYDNVLGAYGGELDKILSIGGDNEAGNEEIDNTANRFEPVVKHLGPFQLSKGRSQKHRIKLPNYVGAVRVMAVASKDGAYGAADKRVPVRNPLMVLSTLPRILSPGDELKVPVNVFVTGDKVKRAKISIKEASGLVDIVGSRSKNVSFNGPGDDLVEFDVKVRDGIGIARFEITAEGNGESSKQEIEIQVRNPNPYQTTVVAEIIDPGKSWSQSFDAVGMQGTNEVVLEVSNIPPINLGRRLKYLLRYPYGCIEQTTSSAFPQLFVNKLIDLDDEQKAKIPTNIKAAINRLKTFQTSNGGFAYWPGQSSVNHWGTNYGTHFLLEAKALGYQVPESMLNNLVKFQKKTAKLWSPRQADFGFYSATSQQLNQAYRLYTLALAGEPDMSSMNRLRAREDLKLQARWRLAAAYALAGKDNISKELTAGQQTSIDEYQELSYTFGSNVRDQAMILETLTLMENDERVGTMVQDLSKSLSSQRWYSTQTTAYSLLAIAKFVGISETDNNFAFNYQVNGARKVDASSKNPVIQVDLGDPKAKENQLQFTNRSNNKLFARIISSGQPRPGLEKGSSNDLTMTVAFKNTDGSDLEPSNLPQGKDFIAEVTVRHPKTRLIRYDELALTQTFPSGWEIINRRMDGLSGADQSRFDYQDIRDDRVDTFFDLRPDASATYRVLVNAAYQGRFYLPAVACGAMYDNTISAFRPGQWVEVVGAADL